MDGLILAARKQYQNEMQQQAHFETRIGLHKTSDANPKNIQMGMVAVYTFFRISSPKRRGTRLFVVQGDAGAGKSEFIKNMIYDWAYNKARYSLIFKKKIYKNYLIPIAKTF